MMATIDVDALRQRQETMAALMKPVARIAGPKHDYGDGDECPNPPAGRRHGRMYVLKRNDGPARVQWCAHSDHVGRRGKDGAPDRPRTRDRWPLADDAFAAAVTAWKEQQSHG